MAKKILVIEDEDLVRDGILLILRVNGYEMYSANNGRSGVNIAKEIIPDLIISDIMMPELDGLGVLQELRAYPATSTAPFLFLSARADKSDIRSGMNLGADDYLTKPFEIDELLQAVNSRLDRAVAERTAAEELAEVKLNELRVNLTFSLPHEFLTPLNGILGLSNLLVHNFETFSKADAVEMLQEINISGKRLHRLIENFLLYSKLEYISADVKQLPEFRKTISHSAAEVIEDMSVIFANSTKRAGDLLLDLQDSPVLVSSVHLSKVMEELLDNAFKFSDIGKKVVVSSFRSCDSQFCISIADSGRGMTAEQVDKIGGYMQFERHAYEQQGAGLGLAIAKKLTTLYDGDLQISSTPSGGTTVTVHLKIPPDDMLQ